MIQVKVTPEILSVCPNFIGIGLEAAVINCKYSVTLWNEINNFCEYVRGRYTLESLKEQPSIAATRKIYRLCGKDPSRYRPSAEALIRRILQHKPLYQVDVLVDLVNLASMMSGYSIGAFDADKFVGQSLALGIGREGEPYEGIGRGVVNIQGLPVYRDEKGGVGTPTTDNERTKITASTTHLFVTINGYDGNEQHIRETAKLIQKLLKTYCSSDGGTLFIY